VTRAAYHRVLLVVLIAAMSVLAVSIVGCAAKTAAVSAPISPTPAQVQVAAGLNALAQAVDGAVSSSIAARDSGKCSQADLDAIFSLSSTVATAGKFVDAELRSSDSWPVQKLAIAKLVSDASLGALKARISPGAQLLVVSLVVVVNQISTAVGGPVI
jgi:hypothetical protein